MQEDESHSVQDQEVGQDLVEKLVDEGGTVNFMHNFKDIINTDNIDEAVSNPLPPKLHRLLRMGLSNKEELETTRRALRSGERSLANPKLRKILVDLLGKFVDAVEDDNEIFRRMRNRVQKGKSNE